MAPQQAQFKGYAVQSPETWDKFEVSNVSRTCFGLALIAHKVIDFEPKRMEDYDIEIAINCCGESLA